jgi:hypothetical protein
VRNLRAWQVGAPLLSALPETVPTGAREQVERCLHAVARGCHRFHAEEKAEAYRAARDHASAAVAALLLDGGPDAVATADRLEAELLPALTGLLRRVDRPSR